MWVRIQRRRWARRLGLLALAAAAAWGGALVARHRARADLSPVRIDAALDDPLRQDGSAPVHAVWRLRFEGAELRVYRNALGVVRQCPGAPGCTQDGPRGRLALPLDAAGEYRALVFSRPGAGDGRTLQGDLAAARERGAQVEMSSAVVAY